MSLYFTEDSESELSNWYLVDLTVGGNTYRSVEHMYQSFRFLPRNPTRDEQNYAYLIRNAETPEEAKYLGNHPSDFNKEVREREDWHEIREDVMLECLRAKFNQCLKCREALRYETGDIHLQNEAKPNERNEDFYWGTGFDDLGKDRLGALLMIVQREIELNYPDEEYHNERDEQLERLWRETSY